MSIDPNLPLSGKTVVLTRSQDQQAEARILFEEQGAKVLDMPALVIGPPDDWTLLDKALLDLNNFDWIIFSSANGVKAVDERMKFAGSSLSNKPKNLNIAAMGRKTAEKLKLLNLIPDFVPPEFIADSFLKHFPLSRTSLRVLIPRVQTGGRTLLAETLSDAGASVMEVPAYESTCPKNIPIETVNAINNGKVDLIVFSSAKTAFHTSKLLQKFFGHKWKEILLEVKIISIGPQTSINCKKYFDRLDGEAIKHDLNGLVQACIQSIKV
ncbi:MULTISPECIES: uroporphyrinogen-III synthase [Prochlorococcus]|uniref:Uroporphyrinogen-III synthase n=1 Tax=Prochlorococcus marinus (strain SARG / CCMP1375 / SS120) TaxID=167539 RepID=Q7VE79_PROMA|nr:MULTISPECIES: uroporphyrinogen-III synthase [Prochlorococcus]AAP99180.1 Uroporphyrin-III synthase [Prochlorococcus marinus subsp. marinus str. CCMP1375]KGG11551.1 Uroporphyrinogen-III synthase [Prochlorococcus marinus str. LG]KGG18495.1 Uroporphyrinogen-III synthase [Prochlorococcus marinus str. SS2]KGG22768.1 Uroporphyrinogen-III synthase [Prochlorococcus marinus str. SS35]KGG32645.1 Uroporphyrinogen-III synthase [Prochlorococcus marinus str. SS51]